MYVAIERWGDGTAATVLHNSITKKCKVRLLTASSIRHCKIEILAWGGWRKQCTPCAGALTLSNCISSVIWFFLTHTYSYLWSNQKLHRGVANFFTSLQLQHSNNNYKENKEIYMKSNKRKNGRDSCAFSAIFTTQLVGLDVLLAALASRAAHLFKRTASRYVDIYVYIQVCKNVAIIIDININWSAE